tara:strand:- start:625 stop:1608 length:984 start_codon:yes stop_codon:yes gene_type:complete
MQKHLLILSLLLITACTQDQPAAIIELPAVADDVVVGDDGSDNKLRAIFQAAALLPFERVELALDPAINIATVSSIASDAAGNFYIIHRGEESDSIIVTDPQGRILRNFGAGLFARPHTIRLDEAGNIWTVDSTSSMIRKFTPLGAQLLEISVGNLPEPMRDSCGTSDIAFADNGNVFVSDGYCNARIIEYDARGQKLNEWGSPGLGPGEFNLPHAISISPEGNVYVADRENGRIQWFTQEGTFLGEWHFGGRILSITFSPSGNLYIGAEPKGANSMQEGYILQLELQNREVLGKIPGFAHALGISDSGIILGGSLTEKITLYFPSQ